MKIILLFQVQKSRTAVEMLATRKKLITADLDNYFSLGHRSIYKNGFLGCLEKSVINVSAEGLHSAE